MSVVAEGVMTHEQFQMLRAKGCDRAQGYLFSYPLPPESMKKWLGTYELR
jgi:EAL domain-containing protein (putative c-di-GMP-specific phosphodiesterase class I)